MSHVDVRDTRDPDISMIHSKKNYALNPNIMFLTTMFSIKKNYIYSVGAGFVDFIAE